jgi:hypothetical protein
MTLLWNVDSTYVLPICSQFMIIWHMVNSSAGVSMIDSIVQFVWTLMHLGFSTVGKSVSLIIIEDSFPWVTSWEVTKSHFRKARALKKDHQNKSLEQISWKFSVDSRSQRMVGSKVTTKSTIRLIKVIFMNSLIQKHWYYPTIMIWCIRSVTLWKAS